MKIYFASPFFNPEQVEREERLKAKLRSQGFDVWSPKENVHLKKDATEAEQIKAFEDNLNNIVGSDIIFVVTDGKDVGTIWEAGFASGFNKNASKKITVVYYCESLPEGGKFNVMLARSGDLIYTKFEQLDTFKEEIENFLETDRKREYTGFIE